MAPSTVSGTPARSPKQPYESYLHLDQLLTAQHPRSPNTGEATAAAEHFFIIVHQVSELWAKQALLDLDMAVTAMRQAAVQPEEISAAVVRAAACVRQLIGCLRALDHLPREHFARFRPLLGTASGAQSEQLRRLFDMVFGSPESPSPLLAAFGQLTGGRATGRDELAGELGGQLSDLSRELRRWQTIHLQLVRRMIGEAAGTGRTAGAEWLSRRIRRPFPELRTRAAADRVSAGTR